MGTKGILKRVWLTGLLFLFIFLSVVPSVRAHAIEQNRPSQPGADGERTPQFVPGEIIIMLEGQDNGILSAQDCSEALAADESTLNLLKKARKLTRSEVVSAILDAIAQLPVTGRNIHSGEELREHVLRIIETKMNEAR